jgi:hypothetical protein
MATIGTLRHGTGGYVNTRQRADFDTLRGAFDGIDEPPSASRFYADYLARLRERIGGQLFATVYQPTLSLLAAAAQPVALAQLQRWGVPRERLEGALLDLGDFLRAHRGLSFGETLADGGGEGRFELAHEDFVRFLRADEHLAARLREAHGAIGGSALARWTVPLGCAVIRQAR